MLDQKKLVDIVDRIYVVTDIISSYDSMNTDIIEAYTSPEDLAETLYYVNDAILNLLEAKKMILALMQKEA